MARHSRDGQTTKVDKYDDPWEIFSASAIGADHVRARMPNQDGVLTNRAERPGRPSLPVFAVADGHGHIRHFRSDRGSRFAVTAACSVARKWAADLPASEAPSAEAASSLVSAIVARWRELVAEDLASSPITEFESVAVVPDDPPEIPYGSTLLVGVLTPQVAVLGQVGDGEIILILPDGRALSPVPTDPRLDGTATTSLCQPDAVSSFRVALVNLAKTPVYGVFAATDGYGNAQAEANWAQSFAADLVRLGSTRGTEWIGGELPGWAATCASSDGSGDDTTVALALNQSVTLSPPQEKERPSPFSGPGRTLALETAPGDAIPAWTQDAGTTREHPKQAGSPAVPAAGAGQGSSSRPTVPARARPRSPWDEGPPAPAWSAPKPRSSPGAFLLRPQIMLPVIAVLVLAVAGVVVLSMRHSGGTPTIRQTVGSTIPASPKPSHTPGSVSPTARPTPRNSLTPSSPADGSAPKNSSQGPLGNVPAPLRSLFPSGFSARARQLAAVTSPPAGIDHYRRLSEE
ncbi:MAG TPA: protein phosphatase 2C domain-containing protein [Streptosporangiaceae bacterium]|nr:protein phosphatase 2C domain-containing protein [Streptosporangiaceae bacterium]